MPAQHNGLAFRAKRGAYVSTYAGFVLNDERGSPARRIARHELIKQRYRRSIEVDIGRVHAKRIVGAGTGRVFRFDNRDGDRIGLSRRRRVIGWRLRADGCRRRCRRWWRQLIIRDMQAERAHIFDAPRSPRFFFIKTARINQRQRIVADVPIGIERLRIENIRNDRIRRRKSPNARIVQPPAHVDEAEFVVPRRAP